MKHTDKDSPLSILPGDVTDLSVREWKDDVMKLLNPFYENLSTHAMSDHELYLKGRKDMLYEMMIFICRA